MTTAPPHPQPITPEGHVEPVPRRIRAVLGGRTVLDTTSAVYRWDHEWYPAYYVPEADLDADALEGALHREPSLEGRVRVDWDAVDVWLEEDEEVFVHPRSPYVRVDALRSTRSVRVELDGVVLAEAISSVMVFETGLPTRYYLDRTNVHWEHLEASDTQTPCPYKGRTSAYWSVRTGEALHEDLAWRYDFPTRQLLPIAGLIAFYNEKLDIVLDGVRLDRPHTKFS
ncbi:MAG: DUF427 domain-containing protein [Nocardioides sp.]